MNLKCALAITFLMNFSTSKPGATPNIPNPWVMASTCVTPAANAIISRYTPLSIEASVIAGSLAGTVAEVGVAHYQKNTPSLAGACIIFTRNLVMNGIITYAQQYLQQRYPDQPDDPTFHDPNHKANTQKLFDLNK